MENSAISQLYVTKKQDQVIWSIDWNSKGNLLASCSGTLITIYKFDSGEKKLSMHQEIQTKHKKSIRSIQFSPNDLFLVSGSFDNTIILYGLEKNKDTYKQIDEPFVGHISEIKCLNWHSSGKYLCSCSRDKQVWVWEFDGQKALDCSSILENHQQDVKYCAFIPCIDGNNNMDLVSSSFDNTIKYWRYNPEEQDYYMKSNITSHTDTVWCLDFTPNGQVMASVSSDQLIKLYHKNTQGINQADFIEYQSLSNYHNRPIYFCAFNSDGVFLATVGGDNVVNIFQQDFDQEKVEQQFPVYKHAAKIIPHSQDINCCVFHPKDNILATASDDKTIRLFNIELDL